MHDDAGSIVGGGGGTYGEHDEDGDVVGKQRVVGGGQRHGLRVVEGTRVPSSSLARYGEGRVHACLSLYTGRNGPLYWRMAFPRHML